MSLFCPFYSILKLIFLTAGLLKGFFGLLGLLNASSSKRKRNFFSVGHSGRLFVFLRLSRAFRFKAKHKFMPTLHFFGFLRLPSGFNLKQKSEKLHNFYLLAIKDVFHPSTASEHFPAPQKTQSIVPISTCSNPSIATFSQSNLI